MLDQLESGPWPSFVTGLKRLAKDKDYMVDLVGQLETSYQTQKGYWKGGTVGVFGYGGGVIPRFTELKDENDKPCSRMPPSSTPCACSRRRACTTTPTCCARCATSGRSTAPGLIAFHGQSGDIMFQGAKHATRCRTPSTSSTSWASTSAAPARRCAPRCRCVGAARCEQSCYDEAKRAPHR